ncbi:MAG: hypothetical protein U1F56_00820 [Rubrivivax sp.]
MAIQTVIAERGFSKWYERELLRGHSQLVLVLLCAVSALGAAEAFSQAGSQRLLMALSMAVSAAVGAWSVRRYLFHLHRAEFIASQATCPSCAVYGRFRVDSTDGPDDAGLPARMQVCCRRCGTSWLIES